MVVALGLMLKGSSEVLSASSGHLMPPSLIILVMTALFVIYGLMGGLAAAIYIDFMQGILTIVFSFMLLPMIMNAIGGMAGLRQGLAGTDMLSLVVPADISVFYVTVMAINGLVGIVTQPHVMGNCAAGKTEIEGAVGFMGGNFLKRICTIPWSLIGVAGVVYFAGRQIEPDKVFGTVANEFLSKTMPGMLGIFIAGVMASVPVPAMRLCLPPRHYLPKTFTSILNPIVMQNIISQPPASYQALLLPALSFLLSGSPAS